jgi:hypothetical protein
MGRAQKAIHITMYGIRNTEYVCGMLYWALSDGIGWVCVWFYLLYFSFSGVAISIELLELLTTLHGLGGALFLFLSLSFTSLHAFIYKFFLESILLRNWIELDWWWERKGTYFFSWSFAKTLSLFFV